MSYTLITGASSGIGEQFARQLAAQSHDLILVARSEDKLQALAHELQEKYRIAVVVIAQDLADPAGAEKVFAAVKKRELIVDLLINNAGVGLIGEFETHEYPEIEKMLILNIVSLTKLIYLFLEDLHATKGTVLNVASQAAFEPFPYFATYGATKSYVLNLTVALRAEYEDKNITFSALCPGATDTNFFKRAGYSKEVVKFKFSSPEEVVATAIKGLKKGKSIIMPGIDNRFMTFVNRFLPTAVITKMTKTMVKK